MRRRFPLLESTVDLLLATNFSFSDDRASWKVKDFAMANGLTPVGAAMFYAQH